MCFSKMPSRIYAIMRYQPDVGLLTSEPSHDVGLNYHNITSDLFTTDDTFIVLSPEHQLLLSKIEDVYTMNKSEDEPSSGLNGRLRPRKSTVPNAQNNKTIRKSDNKTAQDKPKRTITPSKASSLKPDDLPNKSDILDTLQLLCPYCDRKFASKQTVSKHVRRIHFSGAKQDSHIGCIYCNHAVSDSNEIIRHMVDSHPNQYFACLDCHTRFPSTSELSEHKLNMCEKQKISYRSKLRQKSSSKKQITTNNKDFRSVSNDYTDQHRFNGIVISCELKPTQVSDEADIENNITTNLILPPNKSLCTNNATIQKNAVIVLDDIQWNKRMPTNFSFHNTDADQILSRLGVVHRSPRTGETTKKDWFKNIDETTQKFERCFDTGFYSKVASNVQENLTKFLDGSFNFNPDADTTIKTRKLKNSVVINTAEGFPILLAFEQFSRNAFDGYMPRTIAPKHKWKWENDKNPMHFDDIKRDSHVNNCIITLVSSLDIWTQLCMRRKFESKFSIAPLEKKTEKQAAISNELKDILESREIPTTSTQLVNYIPNNVARVEDTQDFPATLGLRPSQPTYDMPPAVLSGEWVRPRCYVCCACGAQTRDSRGLSSHISTHHPNAHVQHYEIVGEQLLNADILKHLYVPPSQLSNRTRPLRGFRECTKCKKSITLEELHQHMLDCAGDTPTVRRKCRYRPFGVRKRRPRLPDNTIRKKIRKDIRRQTRQSRQKPLMRSRTKIRSEVGDAETIRKMLADLPAKRHRAMVVPINSGLRPRIEQQRNKIIIKRRTPVISRNRNLRDTSKNLLSAETVSKEGKNLQSGKKHNKNEDDNKPLKPRIKRVLTKTSRHSESLKRKVALSRAKRRAHLKKQSESEDIQQNPLENTDDAKEEIAANSKTPTSEKVSGEQFARDIYPERIDLNNGPYNTREQSSRNWANKNDQQRSERIEGPGMPGGSGQNGNINNAFPSNLSVPLKHSIARLTSGASLYHENDLQCQQMLLMQQGTNNINQHMFSGQHRLFENEAVVTKLDKPPLHFETKQFEDPFGLQKLKYLKPRKGLNDCIAMLKNKLVDPIPPSMDSHGVDCVSDEHMLCTPVIASENKSTYECSMDLLTRPAEVFSRHQLIQNRLFELHNENNLIQQRVADIQYHYLTGPKPYEYLTRANKTSKLSRQPKQKQIVGQKRESTRRRSTRNEKDHHHKKFRLPPHIELIPQRKVEGYRVNPPNVAEINPLITCTATSNYGISLNNNTCKQKSNERYIESEFAIRGARTTYDNNITQTKSMNIQSHIGNDFHLLEARLPEAYIQHPAHQVQTVYNKIECDKTVPMSFSGQNIPIVVSNEVYLPPLVTTTDLNKPKPNTFQTSGNVLVENEFDLPAPLDLSVPAVGNSDRNSYDTFDLPEKRNEVTEEGVVDLRIKHSNKSSSQISINYLNPNQQNLSYQNFCHPVGKNVISPSAMLQTENNQQLTYQNPINQGERRLLQGVNLKSPVRLSSNTHSQGLQGSKLRGPSPHSSKQQSVTYLTPNSHNSEFQNSTFLTSNPQSDRQISCQQSLTMLSPNRHSPRQQNSNLKSPIHSSPEFLNSPNSTRYSFHMQNEKHQNLSLLSPDTQPVNQQSARHQILSRKSVSPRSTRIQSSNAHGDSSQSVSLQSETLQDISCQADNSQRVNVSSANIQNVISQTVIPHSANLHRTSLNVTSSQSVHIESPERILNVDLQSPVLQSQILKSPTLQNKSTQNPSPQSHGFQSQHLQNGILSTDLKTQSLHNPNIRGLRLRSSSLPSLNDQSYKNLDYPSTVTKHVNVSHLTLNSCKVDNMSSATNVTVHLDRPNIEVSSNISIETSGGLIDLSPKLVDYDCVYDLSRYKNRNIEDEIQNTPTDLSRVSKNMVEILPSSVQTKTVKPPDNVTLVQLTEKSKTRTSLDAIKKSDIGIPKIYSTGNDDEINKNIDREQHFNADISSENHKTSKSIHRSGEICLKLENNSASDSCQRTLDYLKCNDKTESCHIVGTLHISDEGTNKTNPTKQKIPNSILTDNLTDSNSITDQMDSPYVPLTKSSTNVVSRDVTVQSLNDKAKLVNKSIDYTKSDTDVPSTSSKITDSNIKIPETDRIESKNIEDNSNINMDLDPETAKKIAMLPKELVEILGTMPVDHRNQLLNVLPHYVTKSPILAVRSEKSTTQTVTSSETDLKAAQQNQDEIYNSMENHNEYHSVKVLRKDRETKETVFQNILDSGNIIDLTDDDTPIEINIEKVHEDNSKDVSVHVPPVLQFCQKKPNDANQTASLRAVRIKTPSERKISVNVEIPKTNTLPVVGAAVETTTVIVETSTVTVSSHENKETFTFSELTQNKIVQPTGLSSSIQKDSSRFSNPEILLNITESGTNKLNNSMIQEQKSDYALIPKNVKDNELCVSLAKTPATSIPIETNNDGVKNMTEVNLHTTTISDLCTDLCTVGDQFVTKASSILVRDSVSEYKNNEINNTNTVCAINKSVLCSHDHEDSEDDISLATIVKQKQLKRKVEEFEYSLPIPKKKKKEKKPKKSLKKLIVDNEANNGESSLESKIDNTTTDMLGNLLKDEDITQSHGNTFEVISDEDNKLNTTTINHNENESIEIKGDSEQIIKEYVQSTEIIKSISPNVKHTINLKSASKITLVELTNIKTNAHGDSNLFESNSTDSNMIEIKKDYRKENVIDNIRAVQESPHQLEEAKLNNKRKSYVENVDGDVYQSCQVASCESLNELSPCLEFTKEEVEENHFNSRNTHPTEELSECDNDVNTTLRRSRRGKSLSENLLQPETCLEHVVEPKIPITKKQLIFSKLLLDESKSPDLNILPCIKKQDQLKLGDPVKTTTVVTDQSNRDIIQTKEFLGKNNEFKRRFSPYSIKKHKKNKSACEGQLYFDNKINDDESESNHASLTQSQKNKDEIICFEETLNEASSGFNLSGRSDSPSQVDSPKFNDNKPLPTTEKRKINSHISFDPKHSPKSKKLKLSNVNYRRECRLSDNYYNEADVNGAHRNAVIPLQETRTACYNLPIPAKRGRSKSVVVKPSLSSDLYDPYDIDLEDMAEHNETFKRNTKSSDIVPGNSYKKLKSNTHQMKEALVLIKPTNELITINNIKECKQGNDEKSTHSDSDTSSKSDIPLQKYVEEKVKKSSKVEITILPEKCGTSISVENNSETINASNIEANKAEQDLRSEQFMESFGFFSERKPRKSNLLATKKISETFHTNNESDDMYFGFKEKSSKKSINDNKKSPESDTFKVSQPNNPSKKGGKRGRKKKSEPKAFSTYCNVCKKEFRRPDNLMRHKITIFHISKLLEVDMKVKSAPVHEEPNYLLAYKQYLERFSKLTDRLEKLKQINPKAAAKIVLPTMTDILSDLNRTVREQQLSQRGLSRDEALFLDCCELLKESHKGDLAGKSKSTKSGLDTLELALNQGFSSSCDSDDDVDSITAQNILESEEVRNLENDLISGLKEAANASHKSSIEYQYADKREVKPLSSEPLRHESSSPCANNEHNQVDTCTSEKPRSSKVKKTTYNTEVIPIKEKMYPDIIEDIDMFEDKFDKIKRKCRSQAAAAKLNIPVVETNISQKVRRKSDKKKGKKNSKKVIRQQSTQVPTKGALKEFDGVKVSIPTSDINMPALFSAPENSTNNYVPKNSSKNVTITSPKNSPKDFEKGLSKDSSKDSQNYIPKDLFKDVSKYSSKKKKSSSHKKKGDRKESVPISKDDIDCYKGTLAMPNKKLDVYEFMDNEDAELFEFRPSTLVDRLKNTSNKDLPSKSKATAEPEENAPESGSDGDDFVYMSDDYVCSDDENSVVSCENVKVGNDLKKNSSQHKKKDMADKNAVMGKIFKHNALRTEKKNIPPKEIEKPKANLDQLFDSLLEGEASTSKINTEPLLPNKNLNQNLKQSLASTSKYVPPPPENDEGSDDFSDEDADETYPSHTTSYNKNPYLRQRTVSRSSREYTSSQLHSMSFKKYEFDEYGPSTSKYVNNANSSYIDYGPSTSKNHENPVLKDYKASPPKKYDYASFNQNESVSFKPDNISPTYTGTKKKEETVKSHIDTKSPETKPQDDEINNFNYNADGYEQTSYDEAGVARQRARRKCTVGKQNVLAETWSSESEPDGSPPRPNSAESDIASSGRKKKGRKKDNQQNGGKRGNNRQVASKKQESECRVSSYRNSSGSSGAPSIIEDPGEGTSAGPIIKPSAEPSKAEADAAAKVAAAEAEAAAAAAMPAPAAVGAAPAPGGKTRPRTVAYYWSSEGDDEQEHMQQHGWIVGDSHKKLVTMLAHAKGRKRNNDDKRHFVD